MPSSLPLPARRAPRSRRLRRVLGAGLGLLALGLAATSTTPALGATSGTKTFVTSSVPPAGTGSSCVLGPKLVPTCGTLMGAAPNMLAANGTQDATKDVEVAGFEKLIDRSLDIVHAYHVDSDAFPNPYENAVATDPAHPRILLVNWRPGTDKTWAAAASGAIDSRIDAEAARLIAFKHPIMLAIWHEPEHFVNNTAGSGMTATDYHDMVRHVILRLKAKGVSNAVFVQIYQGFPKYATQPWWPSMYPGDDVIDWLATDSYNLGNPTGWNSGDFSTMVNRTMKSWNGWYTWATTQHPGKPLMLAEWGIWYNAQYPTRMAWFYNDVQTHLAQYPALKSLNYYNAVTGYGKGTTRVDATPSSLAAYQSLVHSVTPVNLAGLGL